MSDNHRQYPPSLLHPQISTDSTYPLSYIPRYPQTVPTLSPTSPDIHRQYAPSLLHPKITTDSTHPLLHPQISTDSTHPLSYIPRYPQTVLTLSPTSPDIHRQHSPSLLHPQISTDSTHPLSYIPRYPQTVPTLSYFHPHLSLVTIRLFPYLLVVIFKVTHGRT